MDIFENTGRALVNTSDNNGHAHVSIFLQLDACYCARQTIYSKAIACTENIFQLGFEGFAMGNQNYNYTYMCKTMFLN